MFVKKVCSRNQRSKNKWAISTITLLVALLLVCQPGNTEEQKKNSQSRRLPPAPDTGAPEGDFSAGGTRDNRHKNNLCGVDQGQIAYLLGNKNREFTSSAYPTFWFYLPNIDNKKAQIKFAVTELETGKKIYDRVIEGTKESGIIGIDLPKEKQYALSPEVNYTWSLNVDCAQTDRESEIALEGWLTRLPLQSKFQLQNQLAITPEAEQHTVYLKHNFLYDALTQLAQYRIAQPNNIQIKRAWNELLATLGWQDFIHQESANEKISVSDIQISRNTMKNNR